MSVASGNDQGGSSGEISYRFCQECSNLLYPREDRQLNKLLYVCKACSSVQEHDSACTYRQNLSDAAQQSMGEKAYVANDPTVGEDILLCTMCGNWLKCRDCSILAPEDVYESDAELDALPHQQRECPRCHENDVVFFQSQQRKGDIGMTLYYVCTNSSCNYAWGKAMENSK